jgi:hypothetical protein
VRAWSEAAGAQTVLVFDGPAPGGTGGRVQVTGTKALSADDWIVRAAARLVRQGRPYRLVTSDRGLRARAGADADDLIGGGTFARTLRALPT